MAVAHITSSRAYPVHYSDRPPVVDGQPYLYHLDHAAETLTLWNGIPPRWRRLVICAAERAGRLCLPSTPAHDAWVSGCYRYRLAPAVDPAPASRRPSRR